MKTRMPNRAAAVDSERAPAAGSRRGLAPSGHSASHAQSLITESPRVVAQRQQIRAAFGSVIQREVAAQEDEVQLKAQHEGVETLPAGVVDAAHAAEGAPADRAAAAGGLPAGLKAGVETLSGLSMDHVRVHYDSPQPAQLQAEAYAQGSEIHLAPGQEQHLPHEAWHVVQQAQGRVGATLQAHGTPINDDAQLEAEADRMGARAAQLRSAPGAAQRAHRSSTAAVEGAWMAHAASGQAGLPVQRQIVIGKGSNKKIFVDWETFIAKAPEGLRAGLTKQQERITALLVDDEEHPFESFKALLDGPRLEPQGEGEAQPHEVSGVGVAGQLAGVESHPAPFLLCDGTHSPEELERHLKKPKGNALVLCRDHRRDLGLLYALAQWQAQIFVVDLDAMSFVCSWLHHRHQMGICPNATAVNGWLAEGEYVIVQTPQMRGDMHDVRPALALDPRLKVALCVTTASGFGDADIILGYYRGHSDRVVICGFNGGELTKLGPAKVKKIGEATEVLVREVGLRPAHSRRVITDETTGTPTQDSEAMYALACRQLGFEQGVPYLIVNFRDSGHNPGKGREASHPELDTGVVGFEQLMQAAKRRGFVPVPMGEPPAQGGSGVAGPHLIKYWQLDCCKATPQRNKRQAEYGLLRYLAEHMNIRALAMRSGGTDAMVYAGIETISLDLASSGKSLESLKSANLGSTFQEGGNRSWMRAAVRDLIMPGMFHQGFFEQPRKDVPPLKGSAKPAPWPGAFDQSDVELIDATILNFFGSGKQQRSGVLDLAANSPLAHPEAFAKLLATNRSPDDADRFLTYVRQMNEARLVLYRAMVAETRHENLQLRLENLRLQLEIIRLRLERIGLLLDQLK